MKPLSVAHPFIRLFGRYLRDQGLPVTQQRAAVAEVVFSSDAHLSVDDMERELRERGERIGKATIYRTLDLLVRSRLVEEHDFGEGLDFSKSCFSQCHPSLRYLGRGEFSTESSRRVRSSTRDRAR